MTTIVTRVGKGSPLTWTEVDSNFTNLNNAKYESGNNASFGTISGTTITASSGFSGALNGTVGATTPASGAFTTLSASSTVSGTGFSAYLASPPAIGGTTPAAGTFTSGSFTSLTDSGNLTFTGTGNRITGDFSNATVANRVAFQTSTTNGLSVLGVIPNGTSTASYLAAYNTSTPDVSAFLFMAATSSSAQITSGISGAASYLPMTFSTGGSERMRIDTSGNVGIGTATPATMLEVAGNVYFGSSNNVAAGAFSVQAKSQNNWNFSNLNLIRSSTNTANPRFFGMLLDGDSTSSTTIGAYNAIWGAYDSAPTSGSTSSALNGAMVYGAYAGHRWVTNGSERMRIHASGGVSIGNTTDSGAASLNVSGSISGGYIAHAAGTTAMAFGADNVVRVTPNATATYTTTVPAAGAICVLSILTSGTTSYTITFGTGFKSTGTLATGTVSARYFNITFVSDGTNLIETSRTVAIA